jgi:parallel beta-helix repeat protein
MATKCNIKFFLVVVIILSIGASFSFLIPTAKSYSNHSPIFIHNNSEFQTAAIANSWVGNGLTPETAYIIEDYSITDDIYELIVIENTNVFFEIRNCFFDTVKGGTYNLDAIYLKNAHNGIIFNNTVKYSRHAIFVDIGCSNIVIDTNCIDDSSESGIRIKGSESIDILDNIITNCVYHAIWIDDTSNSIIDGNNLTDCYNGIWLMQDSIGNNITNNQINGTTNGIWVTNSSNDNNVWLNNVNSSEYGIVIADQTIGTNVVNNTIYNCTDYGISFDGFSSYNNVTGNSFITNNFGGTSQGIDNGTSNLFNYNYWNEWTTPDIDTNGIVDVPYNLDGTSANSDSHPLTLQNQYVEHILTGPVIVFPLGGEFLNGTINIQWTPAYDTFDHTLLYNISYRYNSSSWTPIGSEINATHVDWITSESLDGSGYQILVVSYCSDGLFIETTSEFFSIRHHSMNPPMFITPLAGSEIKDIFTIQWEPAVDDFPNHVILYDVYYRHNLSYWFPISLGISETSLDWDTNEIQSGSGYQIRVVASCNYGLTQEIISDSFSIENESESEFPWLYVIAGAASVAILGLSISLGVVSNKLRKTRSVMGLKPTSLPKEKLKPKSKSTTESISKPESDLKSKSKTEPKTDPTKKTEPKSEPKSDSKSETE